MHPRSDAGQAHRPELQAPHDPKPHVALLTLARLLARQAAREALTHTQPANGDVQNGKFPQ